MDGMSKDQQGRICFYKWNAFDPWEHCLTARLTTRTGGYSPPPMATLNLGQNSDDCHYEHNRNLVASALGFPQASWAVGNQVHGVRIATLSGDEKPPYNSCDAILIDRYSYITGVLLADCHPILIYDPVRHIAGIAHAGWRGTLAGIAGILVEKMVIHGSNRTDLTAVSGPGIDSCCYTVGKEVASMFRDKFGDEGKFLRPGEEDSSVWNLSLEKVNAHVLQESGIPGNQIHRSRLCTACNNNDFFSYRRENGNTGRQAAVIVLHFPRRRPNKPFFF